MEALASGVPVLANRAAVDPLSPDLRRAPLLLQLEEPAEWAERILSEARPFQTRTAVEPLDYHSSSLSGARVYEFLRGSPVRATS